jgi:hypothetical protein
MLESKESKRERPAAAYPANSGPQPGSQLQIPCKRLFETASLGCGGFSQLICAEREGLRLSAFARARGRLPLRRFVY